MDLSKIKGSIWFDGEIIDWQDANVHLLTHTLHYGLGVFEGVRAYNTSEGSSIFRLEDHTDRLFKSAETVTGIVVSDGAKYSRKVIDGLTEFVIRYKAKGLAWMKGENVIAPQEIAQARWEECLKCPKLIYDEVNPDTDRKDGRCIECGCFMNVKCHYATAECPIGKWKKYVEK